MLYKTSRPSIRRAPTLPGAGTATGDGDSARIDVGRKFACEDAPLPCSKEEEASWKVVTVILSEIINRLVCLENLREYVKKLLAFKFQFNL
jgi:hypothetical protein